MVSGSAPFLGRPAICLRCREVPAGAARPTHPLGGRDGQQVGAKLLRRSVILWLTPLPMETRAITLYADNIHNMVNIVRSLLIVNARKAIKILPMVHDFNPSI
jgi:hypothetical protein